MAERRYDITATVSGRDDVTGLAEDIGAIEEAAGGLAESEIAIPVSTTGADDTITKLGEVETAGTDAGSGAQTGVETLGGAIEGIGTTVGGLSGPLGAAGDLVGDLGTTMEQSGGKGEKLALAVGAVGLAVQAGIQLWDLFAGSQSRAEETTDKVVDSLNEQVGALGRMREVLTGLVESGDATGLDALNAALLDADQDGFQNAAANIELIGGSYRDVAGVIGDLQTDELATLNSLIQQAGIPADLQEAALQLIQSGGEMVVTNSRLDDSQRELGANINTLNAQYGDQIDAIIGLRAATVDLDVEGQARALLEAERSADGYAEALAQAQENAGPDASVIDVWNEYLRLQNEAAAAAELLAEEQADAAEGAQALNDAMSSVDWDTTDVRGATTALSEFSEQMFANANQIQAQEEAYSRFATAVGDTGLNFDLATETGRAQHDALEGIAGVIDTQLVTAYDLANGSQADFVAQATRIGDETLAKLQEQLNLSAEDVEILRQALGLTADDYTARFELAGVAEAQLQLGLLQGAITGLPAEIEQQVNLQILQGDYVGARDTIVSYYAANPIPTPLEEPDTAKVLNTPVTKPILTELDTAGYDETIAAITSAQNVATITAEADVEDANAALDDAANDDRVAVITGFAATADAEAALDNLARNRTATVFVRTVGGGFSAGGGGQPFGAIARGGDGRRGAGTRGLDEGGDVSGGDVAVAVQPSQVHHHYYQATLQAGVVGNRWEVARAVEDAMQDTIRLEGSRYALAGSS